MKATAFSFVLLAGVLVCACHSPQKPSPLAASPTSESAPVSGDFSPDELKAFVALNPIDAHAHVFRTEPAFIAMISGLNIHLLNITVVDALDPLQNDLQLETKQVQSFVRASGDRAVPCTTFDPNKFNQPGFTEAAIRGINQQFDRGAIAVKIWKNFGMEIKDTEGRDVLPDDPKLEPIYKDIAAHNKTLVAHVADPDSAWQPPNPASPDYSYYKDNPIWYMYGKLNVPSKMQILGARDHVLEQNPNLRVVGAHLGSMEADFHMLGQHLDRYPNFAVDLAARMPYLALKPREDAIAFVLKYQDKLIYGSDLVFSSEKNSPPPMKFWKESYARDWRFLATNDTVEFEGAKGQGLALPDSVLRKIYHDNAVHWFPGIYQNAK